MLPKPKQPPSTSPTWKLAWAALCTVATYGRAHLTALVLSLAGLCGGIAAIVHYSTPVYHAITAPNAKRDADISANAADLADLASQTKTLHVELATATTQIGNLAAQQQATNTAMAVQTVRLTDVIVGQEETNKRLDTITGILMQQAMGRSGDLPASHFATSTVGPAPGGREQ